MIKSNNDLKYYIQEDIKRNIGKKNISWIEYKIKKIIGHENIMACEYLKCLRHLEYSINCRKGFLGKIFNIYYRLKLHKLSIKYGLQISPNTCGYGLRLLHFKIGGAL